MTQETITGYRFAGDVEVKSLILVSQGGEAVDISKIALEVNVFQSLTEHYLQCEVVISDALSLFNSFAGDPNSQTQGGFNGGEVLIVSYKTRSSDLDFKTHFFGVYSITDRQRVDEKIEAYVLNGVSSEAYRSSFRKISRSFGESKGNLISSMVKSVVDEFVYDRQIKDLHRNYRSILSTRIEKDVNIDKTNGLQRFVIPNMTVDDTLDFFACEADCDTHVPYYMFYEHSTGFNFRDLNTLVTQEPKERYVYVATNVLDKEDDPELAVRDFQKIIHYNVIRQTDILGNTKAGLFRSRTINLDILKKNKSEYIFDYEKEYTKFNKLQKFKIPGFVTEEPVVYMMQSRTGHDTCCPLFKPENHLPKRINEFVGRKKSYQRHIFNNVLEVTVIGNSELDVGDVITIQIPNATTLKDYDGKRDKYLSGNYLITKVRHKFGGTTGTEFTTFLECVKDTGIEI